jgi:hypothetical protein
VGELEDRSLWYKYKTDVWLKDTPETATVHNIMRILRCVHNHQGLGYISMPITSGKTLYELMLEHPCIRTSDLCDKAFDQNYCKSLEFLDELKRTKALPVILPADMIPARQHWEQPTFMALWLSIIAEQCTEVYMADGWEYSNGASEEFTHIMQLRLGIPRHKDLLFFRTGAGTEDTQRERMRKIEAYDRSYRPISIEQGIEAIERAARWVKSKGLPQGRLENCVELLHWTQLKLAEGFYQ